ncbi:DUF4349 domain-containing protein [Methanosphaerula palustris]|uniref:DUF4349 domain-containing protein n=1 Tax=Methanosphaerula palustris (strain ATCC BAA-1556 / DSM 19958 / E1-9c) TaxID=521011 RepID=B8GGM3_METPE|nr:DUF4349 domain-containing protein [Methanosphaerula palustris]ACL16278.1 conserved hypothetical protein [Methanosphaerula palustris E1-9c]
MDRRVVWVPALVILVIGLVVAGCMTYPVNNAGSSGASPPVTDVYVGTTSDQKAVAPVSTAASDSVSSANTAETGVVVDQKIVYTAQVGLEVKDVLTAVDTLKTIAAGRGGYLASSSLTTQGETRSAKVVFRVPAAAFENALADVKAAGNVQSVSQSGEDVTADYVDLNAQKTSYQNQLTQYNELMKKSVKVEDIIAVQEQIDRVQTNLDRLEGRLRVLNNRTALSTITVNLKEPAPIGGSSGNSIIDTINTGIAGFFGMIEWLIIAFLTLLPLFIVGGAVYGVYRWRRSKRGEIPVAPVQEPREK